MNRQGRAFVALVAAYAFALQTLFAALVGTQSSGGAPANDFIAICSPSAISTAPHDVPGPAPIDHTVHACCVPCMAATTPEPSDVTAPAIFSFAVLNLTERAEPKASSRAQHPKLSQGPPKAT